MVDREVETEAKYADITIALKACPGRITTDMLKRYKEDPESLDNLAGMVAEVVTWWDIDDDGENMPVTPDNARRIPLLVLASMWMAVQTATAQEGKA